MKYFILLICCLILSSCSHLSTAHLDKKTWIQGANQTISMRNWTFSYTTTIQDGRIHIQGTALPLADSIPPWAEWIQDLWIQVYLSDEDNRVLAKDLRLYLPARLHKGAGIPFDFFLMPESVGASGPLYIAFGYRMELSAHRPGQQPKNARIFFASQGALWE